MGNQSFPLRENPFITLSEHLHSLNKQSSMLVVLPKSTLQHRSTKFVFLVVESLQAAEGARVYGELRIISANLNANRFEGGEQVTK
ncbi:hypothetical protein GIB67_040367 [Kingdonia uniflora]|uniref:Uncharacterized protein n=1 Tax=Kingdonia uniflora TaxID=39325 RepID=A0A7J7L9J3_9MAGN|nr:hypothetical protein GIB67_040367 [Kingdonia uniflora]